MIKTYYPYLKDSIFLKKFDKQRVKEQHLQIDVLDFVTEETIDSIKGRVSSGGSSVSIQGNSAMQRTISLNNIIIDDYEKDFNTIYGLLSLNKKVRIMVGFTNNTNEYKEFPILWFPMGIYLIINADISQSIQSGVIANISLQDKMSLLSGSGENTVGGLITDTIQLDKIYGEPDPTIYKIIQELVNHIGGEQLGRILIQDLEEKARREMVLSIEEKENFILKQTNSDSFSVVKNIVKNDNSYYQVFEPGQVVGYIYQDFTWTKDELTAKPGDSVTSILDKIINGLLTNYYYYYDLDGNFVFKEKKNYLNTTKATVDLNNMEQDDYIIDFNNGNAVYNFDDGELVISYTKKPEYAKVKNDFVLFGKKDNVTIKYHLVIDRKPKVGNTYNCFIYEEDGVKRAVFPHRYSSKAAFPKTGIENRFYQTKVNGNVFRWGRKDPDNEKSELGYWQVEGNNRTLKTNDWRQEIYLSDALAARDGLAKSYYYQEINQNWPIIYDIEQQCFKEEYVKNPSLMPWYIDFIDSGAAISEYSVENIGRRQYIEEKDDIHHVFPTTLVDVYYINKEDEDADDIVKFCKKKQQKYVKVSEKDYNKLSASTIKSTLYQLAKEYLYQYTNYAETVSLNCIPIYYLEPNTVIHIVNDKLGINGDYFINSITLPLDTSGTMTINAVKLIDKL